MEEMGVEERMRLCAAANRARQLYPGPVGELIYRELRSWEDFGHRLGCHRLIWGVVNTILEDEQAPAPVRAA